MTEIEKMYENANVEKEFAYFECHRGRSSICCPIDECEKDDKCIGCINSSAMEEVYKYPPFTAKKQLELIKLLGKRARISLEIDFYNKTNFYSDYEIIDGWFKYQANGKTFEEALAQIVNTLWQDLTDQEKEEIRNILND